jgi:uncharacterized protein (DUF2249 family)
MISLSKKPETAEPTMQKDHYPYGLRLSLDSETVSKLGINEESKVGDEVHINAKARIVRVSEEDEGKICMEVQITDMTWGASKELAMEVGEYIKYRNRQGGGLVPNQGFHPG